MRISPQAVYIIVYAGLLLHVPIHMATKEWRCNYYNLVQNRTIHLLSLYSRYHVWSLTHPIFSNHTTCISSITYTQLDAIRHCTTCNSLIPQLSLLFTFRKGRKTRNHYSKICIRSMNGVESRIVIKGPQRCKTT